MAYADELENTCGGTVADPIKCGFGLVATKADVRAWAHLLEALYEYVNSLANRSIGITAKDPEEVERQITQQILDGVEHPPEVLDYVDRVNAWNKSFDRELRDPKEWETFGKGLAGDPALVDAQVIAVRQVGPIIEEGEAITGYKDRPEIGKHVDRPKDESVVEQAAHFAVPFLIAGAFLWGFSMTDKGPGRRKI